MSMQIQATNSPDPDQDLAWRFFSHIPIILFELDVDGRVVTTNQAFAKLTGYTPQELQGQNWLDLLFLGQQRSQAEDFFRQIQGHDVAGYEITLIRKDGDPAVFEIGTSNQYAGNGELERIFGFGIEISQRRSAGEKIKERDGYPVQAEGIIPPGDQDQETGLSLTKIKPIEEELRQTIEELEVQEEELRSQNEELVFTHNQLDSERRRYQELFEYAPNGYLVTDEHGVIHEVNQAAAILLQARRTRLAGKPLVSWIAVDERKVFRSLLNRLKDNTRVQYIEVNLRLGKKQVIPVSLIVCPGFNDQGYITQLRWLIYDLTAHKRDEEALQLSEARYRAIVEDQTELICRWLPDGRLTFVNQAYCRYFGKSYEELSGANFFPRVAEEDQQVLRGQLAGLGLENPEQTTEHRARLPNGEVRWQQWTNRAILDDQGRVIEIQSVGRDITRRKLAEQALQRQTEFVQLLQEVAVAANEASNIESAIQYALERICTRTGWKVGHAWLREEFKGDLVSLKTWCLPDPESLEGFRRASEKLKLKPGEGFPGLVLAKEAPLWFSDVTTHLFPNRKQVARESGLKAGAAFPIWVGKKVVGVLEFFTDQAADPDEALQEVMAHIGAQLGRVVERKQMETERAELQQRLMDGREAERVQLARELHDGPVQDLYGVSFQFKAYYDSLPELIDKRPAEELQAMLHRITRSLRQITGDLRPPILAHFGLEKAIRSHTEKFQESHPDLQLFLDLAPDGQTLPETVRLALYRIYQSALANVLRHSNATQVNVRLEIDSDQVRFEVQDNGGGFKVPDRWIDIAREGHLGLAGAAERAQAIGGQLQVESTPEKGTKVRVVILRSKQQSSPEITLPRDTHKDSFSNSQEV